MDVSKQNVNDANSTGVSMYLSFDSSMSSAAFKTLEATANDASMLSGTELADIDTTAECSQEGWHQDSTLEAQDHSRSNYLSSVKEMEEAFSPLRAFPKNVLQEHKGACSTPTKEQLLRSVTVTRGCEVNQIFGLDVGSAKAVNNWMPAAENDKENAQPRAEHISNSLTSSAAETVKTTKTTTVKEENFVKLTTIEEVQEITEDKVKAVAVASTSQPNAEKLPQGKNAAIIESTVSNTKHSSLGKNNNRKSICEPNLQANRPSRIVPKRPSPTNAGSKARADLDQAISDIPKLLNRVLKISSAEKVETTDSSICKPPGPVDKRKCIIGAGGLRNRPSLLPAPQAEKRPFTLPQRMSVVVRTTLNSPARKVARRSVLPTAQHMRRSITTAKVTSNTNMARRSVLPVGKSNAMNAVRAVEFDEKSTNWKSLYTSASYPSTKPTPIAKPTTIAKPAATAKLESSFVCSFCGASFRVKSLLDAHKRSHEDGVPTFVRKPSVAVAASANTTSTMNKCKYCDKKFALVRALHIHLMQNCPKIPPSEKRKLEFTEMNHVEKAQLPTFFHANSSATSSGTNSTNPMNSATTHSAVKMPPPRAQSNLSSISISSTESASDRALSDITMIAHKATDTMNGVVAQMAPPSKNKLKKKTAHAGVYRTPNKSITCHTCKKSFKSIMDHIDHNMAVHFMQTPADNGSGGGDHGSGRDVDDNGSASDNDSISDHGSGSGSATGSEDLNDLRAVDEFAD